MTSHHWSWWQCLLAGIGWVFLFVFFVLTFSLVPMPDDDGDYSGTAAAAREDRP